MVPSFFLGGFECSTHRRHDRVRLDIIDATRHDVWAQHDYNALQNVGIGAARDGVRWHLVEASPNRYDWESVLPQIRAAHQTQTSVIWDLSHYGWPDFLDIFSPRYVRSFARFARAFAQVLKDESDAPHFISPVNEISFFSWAGGDVAYFNPFQHERGEELKRQLVRASIAATEAVWEILPAARIVHCDPMIHVQSQRRKDFAAARAHNESQYAAWDMIAGRLCPELGGSEKHLDIVGANYYVHNQWFFPGGEGTMIEPSHPQHLRVRELLGALYKRFRRPILLAETGIERAARRSWLRYIGAEVRAAIAAGVPIEGICLYPICDHPGWDRGRHRHNGLFGYPDAEGSRTIHRPLAAELKRQTRLFETFRAASDEEKNRIVASETEIVWLDKAARAIEAKVETDRHIAA